MCSEIIAFCKNLMLAQAQECMVEKSLLERKRPSLVTKVAWEVSTLYQKAIDLLDSQVCCLFVCLFVCLLVFLVFWFSRFLVFLFLYFVDRFSSGKEEEELAEIHTN